MVVLDGHTLTIEDVISVARGTNQQKQPPKVKIHNSARKHLVRTRRFIDSHWLREDAPPIYGFNVGVGKLKDSPISLDQIKLFQKMLVNSHSAGIGEPLEEEVVRAVMLLRANSLAFGCSGIRIELLERLIAMLNGGVHPVIPQIGSVGASGDLAPLAYLAGALTGNPHAEAYFNHQRMSARKALQRIGLSATFELEAKEGLALVNGTTVSLAIAVIVTHDAKTLIANADIALALSLEAMRGEVAAFDDRIHKARPHPGQIKTAKNTRNLIKGTTRCTTAARAVNLMDNKLPSTNLPDARVQDAYSIRCAPQVHGPVRDALEYISKVITVEINSATDNPLVFKADVQSEGLNFEVLSGGNFHGQYLAQVMDLLAIALTDLGSICERRVYRLLDPAMSYGLPINLVAIKPGLNTGYSIAHSTIASLVTESKTLCWPASVDSIPTKSNQEDHVSNSTWSSRKAKTILSYVQQIVGTELLCAAQAISITQPALSKFRLGKGTAIAYEFIRSRVPAALDGDRWLHSDLINAFQFVKDGSLSAAIEQAIGKL